ncbi:MAG: Pr6Pr family membrane protein, partial [Flavobacterium sp.]|nr:Pr6Pr family membrane protein [Flavobacterium sp.]
KFADVIRLTYNYIFKILLFPTAYLFFILIRGHFSNYYPYPFVDVFKIGLSQALLNSFFVLLAFIIVALIYIKYSKRKE